MSERKLAVMLVGFGGPESLDQVPAFVESVLGRVPPEHVIPAALGRYQAIGGGSPLPATTRRQAALLEAELVRRGAEAEVHVGMLHARPTIDEAAEQIALNGHSKVVVVSRVVDSRTVVSRVVNNKMVSSSRAVSRRTGNSRTARPVISSAAPTRPISAAAAGVPAATGNFPANCASA